MSRIRLLSIICLFGLTAVPSEAADRSETIKIVSYPVLSPIEGKIRDALEERTELAFTDTPLTDALDFLRDVHQITILIDTAALQDEGVDPNSPVNLELSGITFRSALRLLLRPLQLTYVIEDEVLKVTTQAKADENFVTRVYPVHDLASDADDLASVIQAIQNNAAAGHWKKDRPDSTPTQKAPSAATPAGGAAPIVKVKGSITSLTKSRSLVIRHSQQTHEEIEALLQILRTAEAEFARPYQSLAPSF